MASALARLGRKRWWDEGDRAHEQVVSVARWLHDHQHSRRRYANLRYARLYAGAQVASLYSAPFGAYESEYGHYSRLSRNIIRMGVDTVNSRMSKNLPKPEYLTEDGDWEIKERVEKLNQFIEGVFQAAQIERLAPEANRQALIFGTGLIKCWIEDGQPKAEVVLPDEVFVDDAEARNGTPRTIYQRKCLTVDALIDMFPEHEDYLATTESICIDTDYTRHEGISDLADCFESWHLPDKDGKGGKHVIAVEGRTLLEEDWTIPRFPFVFFYWIPPLVGVWGTGIAEQGIGAQLEVNRLLEDRQVSDYMHGNMKVWVEESSDVQVDQLDSDPRGVVMRYRGQPPIFSTNQSYHPQKDDLIESTTEFFFREIGLNDMSVSGQNPLGADASGAALRKLNEEQSARFMRAGRLHEDSMVDVGDLFIDLMRQEQESGEDVEVVYRGEGNIERIKWSEVAVDKMRYKVRRYPVSSLPDTPAAKLQTVTELQQAGFIDPSEARELLGFPDLKRSYNLDMAYRRLVQKIGGLIKSKGEYYPPEPEMDLAWARKYMRQLYLDSKLDGVPKDRLRMMLDWDAQAKVLEDQAMAEAQAQQQPQQPGPPPPEQAPPPEGAPPPPPEEMLPPEAAPIAA